MKGMKKLFALIAVLALALTLSPVFTVNAQVEPQPIVTEAKWVTYAGTYYYQVKGQIINYDSSIAGKVEFQTPDRTMIVEQPVNNDGSFTILVPATGIQDEGMHWVVYNGVPVPVYVQVYKVVVDFGDVDVSKLVSGQYINFEGEVTGIDGRNVNINELYVKNDTATLGTIYLSFNGNRKKGTFTVEDFRVTGPKGTKWYIVSDPNADPTIAAYATLTVSADTKLSIDPSDVAVVELAPGKFDAQVQIKDQFGNPIPAGTPADLEFEGKPYVFSVSVSSGKSYVKFTNIDTPSAYGTYSATLTVGGTVKQVKGKGVLTFTYQKGIVIGSVNIDEVDVPYNIPVNVVIDKEIDQVYFTVDGKDVVTWVNDSSDYSYSKGIYYVGNNQVPFNISVKPIMGGTFTVKVTVVLKNGAKMTAEKEFTVNTYSMVAEPDEFQRDATTTITVTVTGRDGKPVNNAYVALYDDQGNLISGAVVDGSLPQVHINNGVYKIKVNANTLARGWYEIVVRPTPTGKEQAVKWIEVTPAMVLKIQLNKTSYAPGEVITGTILYNDTPTRAKYYVNPEYDVMYSFAYDTTGKSTFRIDTSHFTPDSDHPLAVGKYKIWAETMDGNMAGEVFFDIAVDAVVTQPTDGAITNGVKDVVTVKVGEGLDAGLVSLSANASATLVSTPKYTASGNIQSIVFTASATKSGGAVYLSYDGYRFATLPLKDPAVKFVDLDKVYMGDYVELKVKFVDAHGVGVEGVPMYAELLGYWTLGPVKTGTDGVANFGNVNMNVAGRVRAWAENQGAIYEEFLSILPSRPVQDLKITVTPTTVTEGKATMLTLKLSGADDKPLEAGKNVVVAIGPSTYTGLVGANGVVSVNVAGEAFTGTVVSGVVRVEGYNPATFTIAVTPVEKVQTVIELAPGMDIYTVNGETKFWDATPYIKEGRTLVPIRHLAEAVGFKASWDFSDPANKMVFIFKADQDPEKDKEHPFILLIIGQPTAMVNGNLVALDVAPEILNGRTMVPLRFVVETLGYKVEWLGNTIRLMK